MPVLEERAAIESENYLEREMGNDSKNTTEKEKSQKASLKALQDTAMIIAVLTGLCYLFAFAYQKGYKDYFGIGEVALSSLDISSIVDAIFNILPIMLYVYGFYILSKIILSLIAFIALFSIGMSGLNGIIINFKQPLLSFSSIIYFRFLNIDVSPVHKKKKNVSELEVEDKETKNFIVNVFYVSLIIAFIPSVILNQWNLTKIINLIMITNIIMCFLFIVIVLATKSFFSDEGKKIIEEFLNGLKMERPIKELWNLCNLNIKIMLIVLSSIGLAYIFYQYGYTKAEQKKDYTILELEGKDLIILDRDKDQMLVAPMHNKTISKENIQLVKIQMKENQPLRLRNIVFQKGLKVENNERKEYVNKFYKLLE